jgi:hypothetical protein
MLWRARGAGNHSCSFQLSLVEVVQAMCEATKRKIGRKRHLQRRSSQIHSESDGKWWMPLELCWVFSVDQRLG